MTSSWPCQACTFLNNVKSTRCEICLAHRPGKSSLSPKSKGVSSRTIDLTTPQDKANANDKDSNFMCASLESVRKKNRSGGDKIVTKNGDNKQNDTSSISSNKVMKRLDKHDSRHSNEEAHEKENLPKKAKSSSSALMVIERNNGSSSSVTYKQMTLFGSEATNIKEDKSKNRKKSTKGKDIKSHANKNDASYSSEYTKSNIKIKRKERIPLTPTQVNALFEKALVVLKNTFHLPSLRNLQPQAVKNALSGKSQIIIMGTGSGKSLCYQLPATVFSGTTIVISPLIALMQDQVRSLCQNRIDAALLSSANGEKENSNIMQRLLRITMEKDGWGDASQFKPIKILYCTPEQTQSFRFRTALSQLYNHDYLSLFAIDEAHCLSTWGHDFRPAFRELSWLRNSFPDVPCIACTATATDKVISDIKDILSIPNDNILRSTFNRPNIFYEVRYKDSMGDHEALEDLVNVIHQEHYLADNDKKPCSGIIYVHKRDDTDYLVTKIKQSGIMAAAYHAGLSDNQRKQTLQQWTNGEIKVAVATVAFGMGIDLAHVRYVLHWNMSKSVESFYQESGRAGRDGEPAKSILYYSKDDTKRFAFIINNENKRKMEKAKNSDYVKENRSLGALDEMDNYCSKIGCRRKFLLQHFGETINEKEVCNKSCDYCKDPNQVLANMDACDVSRAVYDVKRQRIEADSKRRFNGQWDRPHGDDDEDEYDIDSNYNDFITSAPSEIMESTPNSSSGFKGFKTAKDILSHYETEEYKVTEKNGFMTFKSKLGAKMKTNDHDSSLPIKSTNVTIPVHLYNKVQKITSSRTSVKDEISKPTQMETKNILTDIEKAKLELEQLKKQKVDMLNKNSLKSDPECGSLTVPSLSFRKRRK